MESNMTLNDICVPEVVSCGRDTTVLEAARLMRHHHTGTLVVVDDPGGDRSPCGVVTDRDIVVESLADELDPSAITVARIMSAPVVIAAASESVPDGMERMRVHGVRRLPVVDHAGSLIGIVALDDLLTLHAKQAAAVAEIVSKEQGKERRGRR
jgi:CBS domain-containing protein